MESQIIDYYNEMPHMVHVIDKMNKEFEECQEEIKELKLQLQNLKKISDKYSAFIKPICIDDDLDFTLDDYEADIRRKFLEWCDQDLTNYGKLSYKLMKDYKDYNITSYEHSLIKYIIHRLNECTHYMNPQWCELFVLSTLEAHGINNTYSYWGAPTFEVENLLNDLSECDMTLLSLKPFER